LNSPKTANIFTSQSIKVFRVVPHAFRHTLTLDNGKENTRFQTLEKKAGLTVFLLTYIHLGNVV